MADVIKEEKIKDAYLNIIFAYPIADSLYQEWKNFADEKTTFINITLSPKMDVCLQNRGCRELTEWEMSRIKEMYQEGYQNPPFADLIIDNTKQTPQETLQTILNFLEKKK